MRSKTERFNLLLTKEEENRLRRLAVANAEGNRSMLFRRLLADVWANPKKFGYRKPAPTTDEQADPQ